MMFVLYKRFFDVLYLNYFPVVIQIIIGIKLCQASLSLNYPREITKYET